MSTRVYKKIRDARVRREECLMPRKEEEEEEGDRERRRVGGEGLWVSIEHQLLLWTNYT